MFLLCFFGEERCSILSGMAFGDTELYLVNAGQYRIDWALFAQLVHAECMPYCEFVNIGPGVKHDFITSRCRKKTTPPHP